MNQVNRRDAVGLATLAGLSALVGSGSPADAEAPAQAPPHTGEARLIMGCVKDSTFDGARGQIDRELTRNIQKGGWDLVNINIMSWSPEQAIEQSSQNFPEVKIRYWAVFKKA